MVCCTEGENLIKCRHCDIMKDKKVVQMRLKQGISFSDFLAQVRLCEDEVLFRSHEGDVLNLKSELCRYLFVFITGKQDFVFQGAVECMSPRYLVVLNAFLE